MSKNVNKVLITGAIITAIGVGTYLVFRPNTASGENPIRVKIDELLKPSKNPKGSKSPLEKLASNIKANLRKLFGKKKKKKKKKDNTNNTNNNNQTDYNSPTDEDNQDGQNEYGVGGSYSNPNEYDIGGGQYGWDFDAQYGLGEYSVKDVEDTLVNY